MIVNAKIRKKKVPFEGCILYIAWTFIDLKVTLSTVCHAQVHIPVRYFLKSAGFPATGQSLSVITRARMFMT